MDRRDFLRTAVGATAICAATSELRSAETATGGRPNILLIMTDQQTASAMSCAGNRHLKTPAMDALAERGMRFNRAYVTQPLCLPCRSSLQTGRYPHEIGTPNNGGKIGGQFPMLGKLMAEAGYACAYIGKWHVGASFEAAGYEEASEFRPDAKKTEAAVAFLERTHDVPFFLTVSFMNPHNVCELARGQALPDGPIGAPPTTLSELPPLPDNFEVPADEPSAIRTVQKSSEMHYPTSAWGEQKWRQYLWGYYRLVEKVDQEIGRVMTALRETGHEQDTVVILVSDHGEGVAMQHWNQKQILYDQCTRVPMIVSWPGKTRRSVTDQLISTALDIPVTILDIAGTEKPASMPGLSLVPLAAGDETTLDREYVVAETMFARGSTSLGLRGRMIRTTQFKYCVYDVGDNREQLFDMVADPGEKQNLAGVGSFGQELNRHRQLLADWGTATGDDGFPFVGAPGPQA